MLDNTGSNFRKELTEFLYRDIPGVNNLTAPRKFPQEVFVTDKISHAGQVWESTYRENIGF